jgi:SEC-C motif domain protein
MLCPCGRPSSYEGCCERFIRGWEPAPTAEDLMRSRFTAYALGEVDYLLETHHPDHRPDRSEIASWAKRARFTALDVLKTEAGAAGDAKGVVEFIAYFEEDGVKREHHERSRFERLDDRWYYVDASAPMTRARPAVGRNDPCPCGSGKKYKKCCGASL